MGGEDFAYYLEKIPGCFFLVGVEPLDKNSYPPLHSDRYDFTDAALAVGDADVCGIGARLYAAGIADRTFKSTAGGFLGILEFLCVFPLPQSLHRPPIREARLIGGRGINIAARMTLARLRASEQN